MRKIIRKTVQKHTEALATYHVQEDYRVQLKMSSVFFPQMACSTVRYGPGVTKEIGQDLEAMGAKRVLVMTDKTLAQMSPVGVVVNSLTKYNVNFSVFDNVRIEPTDVR